MALVADWKETITVKRPSAGDYDSDGHWTEGDYDENDILANVQGLSPSEVQLLPEGFRTRRAIKIYSATELKEADVTTGTSADVIVYEDEEFEVHSAQQYKKMLPHWKTIAVRKPKENDAA